MIANYDVNPAPAAVPGELDSMMVERMFAVNRKKEEIVGYYRLPDGYRNGSASRWITFGATQPGIQISYIRAGWQPMPQYGRVTGLTDQGESAPAADGWVWVPILRSAQGRAEFPPSQILTYRWYHPHLLPRPLRGQRLHFPQLEQAIAGGLEVHEYECPECHDVFFFEPYALASHLRNKHEYDRAEIIALGHEVGIDFQKTLKRLIHPVSSLSLDDVSAPPEAPEPEPEAASALAIARIRPQSTRGAALREEDDLVAMMAKELAQMRAEMAAIKGADGEPMARAPEKAPKPRRKLEGEALISARAALAKARAAKSKSMDVQAEALRRETQMAPVQELADVGA